MAISSVRVLHVFDVFHARFPEYAVSSARLATIQDTIRETSCPASDECDVTNKEGSRQEYRFLVYI